jgi:hypothetical protein
MKTNAEVVVNFKQLGVDITKRQVSKARNGKGSLPAGAIMWIKRGRFEKAAFLIKEGK